MIPPQEEIAVGRRMHELAALLQPFPRSLTGDGVRATLHALGDRLPLDIVEVPTGTPVLDWTIPREWNLHDAWVATPDGTRVVDAADSPLHVMGYSVPFRGRLDAAELSAHLHSLPDHPDWVPYRTSYYREEWGFCVSQSTLDAMTAEQYDVVVDASLEDGALTYGECILPGESSDEVLLSAHVCHPALANDNLSGIALVTALGEWLAERPRRRTYRLLYAPGTLGAIAWLARNEAQVGRIVAGMVVSGVGDPGGLTFKSSRRGDTLIDRAVTVALRDLGEPIDVLPFTPYGYDERQFCSPGFDLPVGRLSRTVHGTYPEYHTSADDLSFISASQLGRAFSAAAAVIDVIDRDRTWRNVSPKGEPQLGRRGLYRSVGALPIQPEGLDYALLWVLNLADGRHSLVDMAQRSMMPFATLAAAADLLAEAELLVPA